MSTQYVNLPPIRKLLQPDPQHILLDCDLAGADAQVVAWEADDAGLKKAFREGMDIHNFNGKTMFGDRYDPKLIRHKLKWRDEMKRGVHGTTYLASSRGLAHILGWPLREMEAFQSRWFLEHPGIEDYHKRLEQCINKNKTITNKFGFRIIYFDRPANILPKAVAWVPQGTVAIVTDRGAKRVDKHLPWVDVLLQVHDSVVMQVPYHRTSPADFLAIKRHLEVEVPYRDPLTIPWGLKISKTSYGELGEKQDWNNVRC